MADKSIIVVAADEQLNGLLSRLITEELGVLVWKAVGIADAKAFLRQTTFAAVVMQLGRDMHDHGIVRELKEAIHGTDVHLIAIASSHSAGLHALNLGADDYLPTPLNLNSLIAKLAARLGSQLEIELAT